MVEEKLYTVQEVAGILRVHEETIRRWRRSGKIKGVLMGGSSAGYRFSIAEIERIRNEGVDNSSGAS